MIFPKAKWRVVNELAKGVLVAMITFTVGTGLTLLSFEYIPAKVTICQLARSPEFYRGRMVTLEAEMRDSLVEDGSCGSPDSWASVWPAGDYVPGEDVQRLNRESDPDHFYSARILVTGRFEPDASPGCFGPKAAIRAASIELRSEIRIVERRRRFIE